MKLRVVTSALILFSVAGCDTETESPEPERRVLDGADAAEEPEDAPRPRHVRDHERPNPADRLCEIVSCTDEQHAEIAQIVRSAHGDEKSKRHDAKDANRAFAEAFRSDAFSADAMDAHRASMKTVHESWQARHADVMLQVYATLSDEQRGKLADEVEAKGPNVIAGRSGGGHGPRGMKWHGDHDKDVSSADAVNKDAAWRGEKRTRMHAMKADNLCERLDCTDDQHGQITTLMQSVKHPDRPERQERADANAKLAAAIRSGNLAASDLHAPRDAVKARKDEHHAQMADLLVELHAILTPQQRGELAQAFERRGPSALMGKRGKHGRRGDHHGPHDVSGH